MVFFGEIVKARELALEAKADSTGRTVTLLGDDDFGLSAHLVHLRFPAEVFVGARLRFLVLKVVLFTVDEKHHVRILLDRSRFTKVGELRTLVVTRFHLTG